MQVHHRTSVLPHPFSSVHEGLCKFDAVVDIIAAATPVEVAPVVTGSPSLMAVAVADLQLPLTAGPGDGIHHSR